MQNFLNSQEEVAQAIAALNQGRVVAFPTETFYGLGVDPTNAQAVSQLLELKSRLGGQGVPFIIDSPTRAESLCDLSSEALRQRFTKLAKAFWPGPLTLVLPVAANSKIDPRLLGDGTTIAIRHSSSEIARQLAAGVGGALPATSANPHTLAPASTWQVAAEYFQTSAHILRGETLNATKPSTLVQVSAQGLKLLREGEIAFYEIEKIS